MKIKVSVVVPVYNAEEHLAVCLDSLISQSLKEIEIILVNDCSTDKSFSVMERYRARYPELITVVDLRANKGPGGARNAGMSAARGEYLGFVDSDDDVSASMFEELYSIAGETDSDLVDCRFFHETFGQNLNTTDKSATGELTLEKRRELFMHAGYIFSKIIRRDIIAGNGIRFRENVSYEDIDFMRVVFYHCKKVAATDRVLYNHRHNTTSLTNRRTKDIQVYQKLEAVRSLVGRFKALGAYDDYKDEIVFYIFKTYSVILNDVMWMGKAMASVELFKELRDFFFELVDCDYHENKYIKKLSEKSKLAAEVNNIDYLKMAYICMK